MAKSAVRIPLSQEQQDSNASGLGSLQSCRVKHCRALLWISKMRGAAVALLRRRVGHVWQRARGGGPRNVCAGRFALLPRRKENRGRSGEARGFKRGAGAVDVGG